MKYSITVHKEGSPDETRIVEAESRFAVYDQIHQEGAVVTALAEVGPGLNFAKFLTFNIGSGIKTEQRITFTKNLSAMLGAGLSLSRALSVIERQTRNKTLKAIVTDIQEEVRKGSGFHEALAKHANVFSPLYIAMTKAGEESGNFAESLRIVAHQMEQSYNLTKKVRGAMIYPSIILFAIVLIGILMLMFVVPTLSATFKSLNVELPLATRIIVSASDFLAHHAVIVFIVLGFVVVSWILFMRSKIGKRAILFTALRMPGIGDLVRETFAARAARTLSSLLAAGVEMLAALSITGEVVGKNPFGAVIAESEARVRKGEALSVAFIDHVKLYPTFVGDMIAVGEETGKVADMLGQVATYYENDVEERTKDLSTIIEPLLMLVIGIAVGIFAIAMIAPIYSLSSKI